MRLFIPFRKHITALAVLFALLLFHVNGFAQTTSWRGLSTNWSQSSNWTAGVPTATSDVIIGDASFTGSSQPTLTTATTIQSLTIGGDKASTLTLSRSLTINGDITFHANGTLLDQGSGSVLSVKGDWTNDGTYTPNSNQSVAFSGSNQILSGSTATTFQAVTISAGSTVTFNSNFSGNTTVSGTLIPAAGAKITGGTLSVASGGTLHVTAPTFAENYAAAPTLSAGSTVNYSGTTDQVIASFAYSTLRISGSGIKTPVANLTSFVTTTSNGNIYVDGGTFDTRSFVVSRSTAGGICSVAGGATLKIGGTNSFPVNFATATLHAASTVEYYGTAQTIRAANYGHLIISGERGASNVTLANSGSIGIAGTLTATETYTTGSRVITGSTVTFNGSSAQTIPAFIFNNLTINNTSGATLADDITVDAALTFTAGKINTGDFKVRLSSGGSVAGAGQSTGWVNGNLQQYFSSGALSKTFAVGISTYYTPMTVTFASISAAGDVVVGKSSSNQANLGSSGLLANIPGFYSITNYGVAFTTYAVSLTWNTALNYSEFAASYLLVALHNGGWSFPSITGTPTTSNIQATGLKTFGDFVVGQKIISGTWMGTVSTDWTLAGNWAMSTVPTATTNVIVPAGLSRYPVITTLQTGVVKNLTIQQGATLTVTSGTLKIAGDIVNSGTLNVSNGATVEMAGTAAQVIPANAFAGNTVYNLINSNSTTLTLQGPLNLTNTLSLKAGVLHTNGHLTLKSTVDNTARVERITSTAATPIVGEVTVERYVPGRRKYRLMASSVTTSTKATLDAGEEALSIWGQWQNSGGTTAGEGTLITGGTTADGFDPGSSAASLYTYNETTRRFVGFTSANGNKTKYTPLQTGKAYYMFVYGDRLTRITAANPNATVLKAKGTLATGTKAFTTTSATPLSPTVNNYAVIGNPYACPVDWNLVTKTNVSNTVWGWDANLNSTGGYVTVTATGTSAIVSPLSSLVQVSRYIQPGQGFFVKTTAANPQVVFMESHKVNTTGTINNMVFRTAEVKAQPLMAINLLYSNAGVPTLADGAVAAFDNTFSKEVTEEDGVKMVNSNDGLSLMEKENVLGINCRPMPADNDTLQLSFSKLTKAQYTLEIFAQDMGPLSVTPLLQDTYLNTVLPLSLSDTNRVIFNVLATDPASSSANRFRIIFSQLRTLPVTFTNVSAQAKGKQVLVQWSVGHEEGIQRYEVERSANGNSYAKVGEVMKRMDTAGKQPYLWMDRAPETGNNWYRIRSVEMGNNALYSSAAMVTIAKEKASVLVVPNPAKSHQINVQVKDVPAGQLTATLLDRKGQEVLRQVIDHRGSNASYTILPRVKLARGIYYLALSNKSESYRLEVFIE